MLAIWLFTIAGITAGFGILFAYKRLMRGLKYRAERDEFHYKGLQKDQIRFFIQVGLIEAIPIFLIILGFMFAEQMTLAAIFIPILLLLGGMIYFIQQVRASNQKVKGITGQLSEQDKSYVRTLSIMGYLLVLGIPLLSLAAMALVI